VAGRGLIENQKQLQQLTLIDQHVAAIMPNACDARLQQAASKCIDPDFGRRNGRARDCRPVSSLIAKRGWYKRAPQGMSRWLGGESGRCV
jgi:hypothetical protein